MLKLAGSQCGTNVVAPSLTMVLRRWNSIRYNLGIPSKFWFLLQTLLPEAPKRSQMIQQTPFYLASSGWQTGYKRNPYMVYPHMSTGLSINDPRRTNQGLSIFDPRGKKATPLQRYLRYFKFGRKILFHALFSSQLLKRCECWSQEWKPPVQHDHQEAGGRLEGGLGGDVKGAGGGGEGGGDEGGDEMLEWGNMLWDDYPREH